MAVAIKKAPKTNKKELEQEIIDKLGKALESFKGTWGEKKFANRVKKATRHFLKGMPQKIQSKTAKPIKKVVKPAKKKAPARVIKKTAEKSTSK